MCKLNWFNYQNNCLLIITRMYVNRLISLVYDRRISLKIWRINFFFIVLSFHWENKKIQMKIFGDYPPFVYYNYIIYLCWFLEKKYKMRTTHKEVKLFEEEEWNKTKNGHKGELADEMFSKRLVFSNWHAGINSN